MASWFLDPWEIKNEGNWYRRNAGDCTKGSPDRKYCYKPWLGKVRIQNPNLKSWLDEVSEQSQQVWKTRLLEKQVGTTRKWRDNTGLPMKWPDLIDCVIRNAIERAPTDASEEDNKADACWSKGYWRTLVEIDGGKTTLDDNNRGQQLMGIIGCIIMGLNIQEKGGRDEEVRKYLEECGEVNSILSFGRDVTEYIRTEDIESLKKLSQNCKKKGEKFKCEASSWSFLLSILIGLDRCIVNRGRYELSPWMEGTALSSSQSRYFTIPQNNTKIRVGDSNLDEKAINIKVSSQGWQQYISQDHQKAVNAKAQKRKEIEDKLTATLPVDSGEDGKGRAESAVPRPAASSVGLTPKATEAEKDEPAQGVASATGGGKPQGNENGVERAAIAAANEGEHETAPTYSQAGAEPKGDEGELILGKSGSDPKSPTGPSGTSGGGSEVSGVIGDELPPVNSGGGKARGGTRESSTTTDPGATSGGVVGGAIGGLVVALLGAASIYGIYRIRGTKRKPQRRETRLEANRVGYAGYAYH
ncbi:hypothetical protein C922_05165 [Plasmodium inui San Antonio 1]|uniref:Uncharacterized protein n=1 Tax=Plasmodium inui San Antonio 1 TaxID=1237626 RepID=W7AGM0_9APIC|nr:hypothetical protein C922_05165 [Plasmodium inui San Antonio 1]EUD64451.1 hypothetical protein C922_05165 [Plasmodium inui San Antonio 1]